jgi:C-terminal processing protease CtpA/Prc
LQEWFDQNHPDWLINNFTDEIYKEDEFGNVALQESLNSLNLSNLYVIITGSSASASELIINGLNPYINITTVGTKTTGKYTASITLYDSQNFGREGANPNHTWAMQPIVLEEINKVGENDKDGFDPTVEVIEYVSEMQELGTETEPLLAEAIAIITGVVSKSNVNSKIQKIQFEEIKDVSKFQNLMYVEKELPLGFRLK